MDDLNKNFGYLTSIMHYTDKGNEWEMLEEIKTKYPNYGLGVNERVRKHAYLALEWVMQNKDYNFRELDSWYIQSNEVFLKKCIILYEFMKKHNLG